MLHVYAAVRAYDNRVLKYQGKCSQREDIDKMFPGVHANAEFCCFGTYMGDRITTNQPHNLVVGTSGNLDQDVTDAPWAPPVLGYWVVSRNTFTQFRWGQDNRATVPFHNRDEVELYAATLADECKLDPDMSDDTFFVMTVFNDGQFLMEELKPV